MTAKEKARVTLEFRDADGQCYVLKGTRSIKEAQFASCDECQDWVGNIAGSPQPHPYWPLRSSVWMHERGTGHKVDLWFIPARDEVCWRDILTLTFPVRADAAPTCVRADWTEPVSGPAAYDCARMGCEEPAVGVYQGITHAALFGACREHLPTGQVRWVHEPTPVGARS